MINMPKVAKVAKIGKVARIAKIAFEIRSTGETPGGEEPSNLRCPRPRVFGTPDRGCGFWICRGQLAWPRPHVSETTRSSGWRTCQRGTSWRSGRAHGGGRSSRSPAAIGVLNNTSGSERRAIEACQSENR